MEEVEPSLEIVGGSKKVESTAGRYLYIFQHDPYTYIMEVSRGSEPHAYLTVKKEDNILQKEPCISYIHAWD